jgi:hypothetical protein
MSLMNKPPSPNKKNRCKALFDGKTSQTAPKP